MAYVWPFRLLTPARQKTTLTRQIVRGGFTLTGDEVVGRLDGGGRWTTELAEIQVRDRDRINAARAWSAHLDGGATDVVMPIWDLAFAPRGWRAGKLALPGRAEPGEPRDWFNQPVGFGEPLMVADLAASAPLRATSLRISLAQGAGLAAGQHFSIEHPTKGWRLYRIARVTSPGTTATVEIRPPLRAAVSAGMAVEFDVPRCLMRVTPESAAGLEPDIEMLRRGLPISATFREAP